MVALSQRGQVLLRVRELPVRQELREPRARKARRVASLKSQRTAKRCWVTRKRSIIDARFRRISERLSTEAERKASTV